MARRKRQEAFAKARRVRGSATGRARATCGRLRLVGQAATCVARWRRCERTRRPSSATSRRDPIRRGRRRPSRSRAHALVRRRIRRERAIISNGRSPCSDRAATTILAFRFGQDAGVAAMLYLATGRWPWARSSARGCTHRTGADADRGPVAHRHHRACAKTARGHFRS